jgi:transposase
VEVQDRDLYARILGLVDPWQVRDVHLDVKGEEVRVIVAPKITATFACPECGKACPGYDARRREWRHLDTCQFKTILVADVPRVNCQEHGVRQVNVPWAEPGSGFTALMEAVVINWLLSLASIKTVAKQLRLSWDEVDGIMGRAVARGLLRRKRVAVRRIGVDETSFQRRHEYVTIVTDLDNRRVLHVADGRKRESLDAFFRELDADQLAAIEAVAMDMCGAFIASVSEHVPDAERKIGFDKFHVAMHLGDAVNRVRRDEHKALLAKGDDSLKGSRFLWTTNPDNMDAAATGALNALHEMNLKTSKAWGLQGDRHVHLALRPKVSRQSRMDGMDRQSHALVPRTRQEGRAHGARSSLGHRQRHGAADHQRCQASPSTPRSNASSALPAASAIAIASGTPFCSISEASTSIPPVLHLPTRKPDAPCACRSANPRCICRAVPCGA